MRRERITYPGAFHHVMNRGYGGNAIFESNQTKSQFLDYLEEAVKQMKIRLFAYCVMDNHYHLILENSSGRLSDFAQQLNGKYGMYYRALVGGKGYVFQSRFKSTLIENDGYLIRAIAYCLQNPVRANIVSRAEHYIWSSVHGYLQSSSQKNEIIDAEFVNQLFGSKDVLLDALERSGKKELSVTLTKHGEVLGSEAFMEMAAKKHDRRRQPATQSKGVKRIDERFFEPVEKVYWEFKAFRGVEPDYINTTTWEGKRLRGEFLVKLRDKAGLKYKEIAEFPVFSDLSFNSLRGLYRRIKNENPGNQN